jgi:hypothetical protein
MELLRLLALSLTTLGLGGCAGLFNMTADPSAFAYSRGAGQIVFQLPLAVVVEEVDRSLTDAGLQVTFRHIDRHGAVVRAKTKDGKSVEATLRAEGMLTQLSLKVGRWGDRDQTEALIAAVQKGSRSPAMTNAEAVADSITDAKAPIKEETPALRAASGRVRGPADPPPN